MPKPRLAFICVCLAAALYADNGSIVAGMKNSTCFDLLSEEEGQGTRAKILSRWR